MPSDCLTGHLVRDAFRRVKCSPEGIPLDGRFGGVAIEPSKVRVGEILIPSLLDSGERTAAVREGLRRQAALIVCPRGTGVDDRRVVEVDDPVRVLWSLARVWRQGIEAPIVVVAGSTGKTTTKEMLAAILKGRWSRTHATLGNWNGEVGLPWSILRMPSDAPVGVLELGIDRPGQMRERLDLLEPSVAIVTHVAEEHLAGLSDIETVAREESLALSDVARRGGLLAINTDDPWLRPFVHQFPDVRKVAFGFSPRPRLQRMSSAAPIRTRQLVGCYLPDVTQLGVSFPDGAVESFALPIVARHHAENLLAAISVAVGLGVSADEIREGLNGFRPMVDRTASTELSCGVTLIRDECNANPRSMRAAIDYLDELTRERDYGRRFLCLGDMLDLGRAGPDLHRSLAPTICEGDIDSVLLVGDLMSCLHQELERRRFPGDVCHFPSRERLVEALVSQLGPRDAVLVKGSCGMRMDLVSAAIVEFDRDLGALLA
ncbi:UDP-N-acetylmuramoyl-tripeptide--D-alanyl-D-alanine ligase MurF [Planctomycetes bacterium Pan216]|uniref:UDP-N-acetylmuramoyl-tripeptide--D-alanyl-D-alanine ligase MurF n=1 Tax=Kolteria novifilia TaxID=2527975 RepID=A0A518BAG6_9BACT|nr:UDP-N-acetylmuramoyl-tripeptide--D-alanyl-D-alanine ligase MurF [Planctomycetes bacterium Pan216]